MTLLTGKVLLRTKTGLTLACSGTGSNTVVANAYGKVEPRTMGNGKAVNAMDAESICGKTETAATGNGKEVE
jgi:hypothetical protein